MKELKDRNTLKKVFGDYLSGQKIDGDSIDVAFIFMAKMKGRLSIMNDILEDIAHARYNNTGRVGFEIDNFTINLNGLIEELSHLIEEVNKE